MICFTDNIKYANILFDNDCVWQSQKIYTIKKSVFKLAQQLFENENLYVFNYESYKNWNYLFINKFSNQSQFDLLYNISKNTLDLPDGILCLADSGSNFRGYRNRAWYAQSGNLHLSIFKKPGKPVPNFHVGFTILAAVSVIQTLDMIPGMKTKAGIKWVNDILIDNAKISGVITQTQSQNEVVTAVVLGIGLNIEKAPKIDSNTFVQKTTCLYDHIKQKKIISISELFANLIDNLSRNYDILLNGDYQNLLNFYRERSIILNRKVEIYSDPIEGEKYLIAKGKVKRIGNDLELYIYGNDNPVRHGRIVLID